MKRTHRYTGTHDAEPDSHPPDVAAPGNPSGEPDRDLRSLAADLVKYCPSLVKMLIAVRSCPPYIGLN